MTTPEEWQHGKTANQNYGGTKWESSIWEAWCTMHGASSARRLFLFCGPEACMIQCKAESACEGNEVIEETHSFTGWKALDYTVRHGEYAAYSVQIADPSTKTGNRKKNYFTFSHVQPIEAWKKPHSELPFWTEQPAKPAKQLGYSNGTPSRKENHGRKRTMCVFVCSLHKDCFYNRHFSGEGSKFLPSYILIEGKSRRSSVEACTHWKPAEPRPNVNRAFNNFR